MSDIVERMTANLDKYPGFQNMNSEAAAEITRLRARLAELEADLEICMNALDRLADLTTMGPAIHANICEAGRNEIETRIAYADEQRTRTAAWQRAGREVDAEEAAARAATDAIEKDAS